MISVCVPVTNREKTIERCLDSVRTQSITPFEVIITEFGSSDNSRAIISAFLDKHALRGKWSFHCRDEVPDGTEDWNFPLTFSNGEYVAILEGDDQWPQDYLKKAAAVIEMTENVSLVFSGSYNRMRDVDFDSKVVTNKEALYRFARFEWQIAPSQVVFRFKYPEKRLFKVDDYKYAPEMQYWAEAALEDGCVVFLSSNQVYRHISESSKFSSVYFNDHFKYLHWLRREKLINLIVFYRLKIKLFSYYLARYFFRKVFSKTNGKGTLRSLIRNLMT
jgi:glycosyltransferase involved in cell wall biosynthesis